MINSGTSEAEQSLNNPKSEEDLADQILTAVSSGDTKEMDRLFSLELEPDAGSEEEEGSDKDPTDDEEQEEESASEDESPAEEEDEASARTQKQELSPAEERLAKLEKELNDAKATAGRTASLASRLAQLENQLKKAEAAKQKAEASKVDSALQERINKLREIDPDTADLFEELASRTKTPESVAEVDDAPDPRLTEEYYKVLAVHTDADRIFQHPYWHMWKQNLSPSQRAWAESSNSQEVIVALNEFKKFVQGFGSQQTEQNAGKQEEVVDATKEAREKKLQRSAESSDTPVKKSKTFDADSFFAESYEKIAKESGITY